MIRGGAPRQARRAAQGRRSVRVRPRRRGSAGARGRGHPVRGRARRHRARSPRRPSPASRSPTAASPRRSSWSPATPRRPARPVLGTLRPGSRDGGRPDGPCRPSRDWPPALAAVAGRAATPAAILFAAADRGRRTLARDARRARRGGAARRRGRRAGDDRDRRRGRRWPTSSPSSPGRGRGRAERCSRRRATCPPSTIRRRWAAPGSRSPTRRTSTSSSTTLERYERGELTPDQWRAFRLVRGTYGQRQADDAQMLRVKIPQGDPRRRRSSTRWPTSPTRYSRGFGHITTRQNVQFHFVKLHDVEPAMRRLAEAGLTTREACGNSVRNITACPYAGRRRRRGLRRHAVRRGAHPLPAAPSAQLDAAAQVQDRLRGLRRGPRRSPRSTTSASARGSGRDGARARLPRDRRRRHGRSCATSARLLFEFLPAAEIFDVAEAVLARLPPARATTSTSSATG